MLTLNLIRKLYIPFCFECAPRTKINARDCTIEWCWKNNPKKKYLKYNIGMKAKLKLKQIIPKENHL